MDSIKIKGARVNNLKNINVEIPRNQLVVITGVSGSGKSSLAFDTLYAEGQRRYVESLSTYARQFMGRMAKPECDFIEGIPPAIAIEQKVVSRNPRSTVGTSTEIYDYLRMLFARVGHTFSPVSGQEVKKNTQEDVIECMKSYPEGMRFMVLCPLICRNGRTEAEQIATYDKQGLSLTDTIDGRTCLIISRMTVRDDKANISHLVDSCETAIYEGEGQCILKFLTEGKETLHHFSLAFEADGIQFEEPTEHMFSFNSPIGACPTCEGFGKIMGIDESLVIPNQEMSVYEGAVFCWRGDKMSAWKNEFCRIASSHDFPIFEPYYNLTQEQKDFLWHGEVDVTGRRLHPDMPCIDAFFDMLRENQYKIQYRVMLSRYRGKTTCPTCHGTRLKREANFVKVGGRSITELVEMPIADLYEFFRDLKLSDHDALIAKRLLVEINNRLQFLMDVGLSYLTLNRLSNTLSGGESQRINLATSLGSSLVGSLYILDEPSIGLHSRDTQRLIKVLKELRDLGNTVVVVEHDEEIIRAADYIIDIGPRAGRLGGEIVFHGTFPQLMEQKEDLTAAYIRGMENPDAPDSRCLPVPTLRRKWRNYVEIVGAKEHNLKNINVKIPLQVLTLVTGVSGSGKSTLIKDILYPGLQKMLGEGSDRVGRHTRIDADLNRISEVIIVDQNPIGKSSRSNPAIYIKAYDDIRDLYASQPLSKQRGYKASFFSFNTPGGRCEECEGEGVIHVSMQFMADVDLECTECHGKHFKDEILEVKVGGKDISDVLNMTINQAIEFLDGLPDPPRPAINAATRLRYLQDVGLGYLKMGQPSHTLSGGESQRVKLAFFLSQGDSKQNVLFIFDEPTTGLHFHDINKLYQAFNRLIEKGNSIVVIEHNPELIKCADWVIDLGPDGGDAGGGLVCAGTPEEVASVKESYTGQFLAGKLGRK